MARKNGKDRGILELPKGSGNWWVRLYVNNRERRFKADTKTQAKTLYGKLKSDIREKRFFPEQYNQIEEITLRSWIDRSLEGFTQLKGYRNQKRYARWWKLLLGKRLITELTSEDIARIQSKALKKGNRSPQTINRYMAFLKHVLYLAVEDGKIQRNPVSNVKFSPEPEGKIRFLSDEEITRIKGVMAPEDWVVVALAIETGLRQSEQFKAKWDWINLEQGILTIPHSKSGKTRHLPLSNGALNIMKGSSSWIGSSYLFPSPVKTGSHRNGDDFARRIFGEALKEAKIEGVTWHTLRHTFASRLVMAGVDLRTVQELMGHSTITMTMRYAHLSPNHLKEAVNRVTLDQTKDTTVTKTVTIEERSIHQEADIPANLLKQMVGAARIELA